MIRKDVIIAVLITFCLTSVLFLTIPSRSIPNDNYNAWADVNCDGTVDIFDAILLANAYDTHGTPIDKSAYPVIGMLNKPAFDSGWTNISRGDHIQFPHFLNTTNVLVYMMGRTNKSASPYIHQIDYGGELNAFLEAGVWWQDLTEASISVYRRPDDTNWDQVRIMIWTISEP